MSEIRSFTPEEADIRDEEVLSRALFQTGQEVVLLPSHDNEDAMKGVIESIKAVYIKEGVYSPNYSIRLTNSEHAGEIVNRHEEQLVEDNARSAKENL